eukprot:22332-Prymnesium_polylepis.1
MPVGSSKALAARAALGRSASAAATAPASGMSSAFITGDRTRLRVVAHEQSSVAGRAGVAPARHPATTGEEWRASSEVAAAGLAGCTSIRGEESPSDRVASAVTTIDMAPNLRDPQVLNIAVTCARRSVNQEKRDTHPSGFVMQNSCVDCASLRANTEKWW